MKNPDRSGCPINLAIEELGDRWSLVILRDVVFGNRRTFSQLKNHSLEKIATNVLGSRLNELVVNGYLTQKADPSHKQRVFYSLTEKAIELVPIFAALGAWGAKYLATSPELSVRALLLQRGGPLLWARFMDELREEHLFDRPGLVGSTVRAELQSAYEKVSLPPGLHSNLP